MYRPFYHLIYSVLKENIRDRIGTNIHWKERTMTINRNELELLSAGYLAAARNNQEDLRNIVNKMSRKYDHWIVILETGAKLSLVSVDLNSEKLQSEPVKWMIGYIGWHGHKTTYSRLNTALVTLRNNPAEISRLKDTNTKGEVMASLLTVTGQVIFRNHDDSPERFESEARKSADNALATSKSINTHDKKFTRVLAVKEAVKEKRDRRSSGGGFWNGAGEFVFDLVGGIFDAFT